jgi:hypothetical protein
MQEVSKRCKRGGKRERMNGEDKHGEASAEIAEHPEELPMVPSCNVCPYVLSFVMIEHMRSMHTVYMCRRC